MQKPLLIGTVATIALAFVASAFIVTKPLHDARDTPPNGPADQVGTIDPLLPTSQPFEFPDPKGDATDTGAGGAGTLVGCAVGQATTGECIDAPPGTPPAGTPGPHFDIVGVAFEGEHEKSLRFRLDIDRLSADFSELKDPEGFTRMIYYQICWAASADSGCDRQVKLDVMGHGGTPHLNAKFEIRNSQCNEWSWCSWGIAHEIEFGAPAHFRFTIPKAYLTLDGGPAAIHHLEAQSGWVSEPDVFPAWHPGVTAHTPAYHVHTHGGAVSGLNIADQTSSYPLDLELAAWDAFPEHPLDEPLLWAGEGANHGANSPYNYPELDILWFDVYEEGSDLVVLFALHEMPAIPEYDFDYSVGVGLGHDVWEIGYRHEGGKLYGYSGRCIMEMCQDGKIMTPVVDVTLGTPGFIAIRTPLEFIGSPMPGSSTNLYWAMTMYSDHNLYWGEYEDDLYGDVHSVFEIDSLRGGGAPFVFGSGHRADLEACGPPVPRPLRLSGLPFRPSARI